jgi:hypothetical protein
VVQWDTTHKQHMWSLSCFNSAQHKAKLNPSKVESPLLSALAFVLLAFFTLQTSFWRLLYTVNMFKYVWRASENMIIIDNICRFLSGDERRRPLAWGTFLFWGFLSFLSIFSLLLSEDVGSSRKSGCWMPLQGVQ